METKNKAAKNTGTRRLGRRYVFAPADTHTYQTKSNGKVEWEVSFEWRGDTRDNELYRCTVIDDNAQFPYAVRDDRKPVLGR